MPFGALSEMEWAIAFLPVLGIQEGLDLEKQLPVSIRSRLFKRTDLAARLGVDANEPFGAQLVAHGLLSYEQGRRVDGNLFRDRSLNLRLRIVGDADDVHSLLQHLGRIGLVDAVLNEQAHEGHIFAELETRRFVELCEFLSGQEPDHVALLSINGSVLYV
jgi:hypothetical protein